MLIIVLTSLTALEGMVYYIPDHVKAYDRGDGGVVLVEFKGQRSRETHIEPDGCVTLSEASRIVQPPVSRVAVHRWIETGKLEADMVEGKYLIELTALRKFVNSEGKAWAPQHPDELTRRSWRPNTRDA